MDNVINIAPFIEARKEKERAKANQCPSKEEIAINQLISHLLILEERNIIYGFELSLFFEDREEFFS